MIREGKKLKDLINRDTELGNRVTIGTSVEALLQKAERTCKIRIRKTKSYYYISYPPCRFHEN